MSDKATPKATGLVAHNRRDILDAKQYKCAVGKEWKPRGSFSKKNLNLLERKVKHGTMVTAANTGMICCDHSGQPMEERRCGGPCNKVKALAAFSKNSLTNGNGWCQTCVQWQLLQDDHRVAPEDGIDPVPVLSKKAFAIPISNDCADGESVVESSASAMFTAPSFSFLRPSDSNTGSGQLLGFASRTSGSIPPHLKSFDMESNGGNPLDADVEERYQPDDASICPDDSASQLAGSASSLNPARLTAAALQQKEQSASQEHPLTYFNSWDNSGRQHMQRRTAESELGSIRSFDTRELSTVVSNDDRCSRGTAPKSWQAESARNKKWGKMPRKSAQPPPIPEWDENDVHIVEDGSESDPYGSDTAFEPPVPRHVTQDRPATRR